MKRVYYDFQKDGTTILLNALHDGKVIDKDNNEIFSHSILLYDEMGMGKTIQTLDTICKLNRGDTNEPILIICPPQCIDVWKVEIEKFFKSDFDDVRVFVGNGISRANMLRQTKKTLFLTSYNTLRNQYKYYIEKCLDVGKLSSEEMERYCLINKKSLDRVQGLSGDDLKRELLIIAQSIKRKVVKNASIVCSPFLQQKWGCVIMDEVHKIKSPSSSAAKAVGFLNTTYRLALSGTPIMNSPFDLFSIIQYGLGLFTLNWPHIHQYPNSSYCHRILETVTFGRTKDETPELSNNLPKRVKVDENVIIPWSDQDQINSYCKVKERTLIALETKQQKNSSWKYMHLLRQICLHKDLPGFMHEEARENRQYCVWSKGTHKTFSKWIQKRVFTLLCCFKQIGGINWNIQEQIIRTFVRYDVEQCIQPSPKMIYIYELLKNHDKMVIYCTFKVFLESIMSPWLHQIGIDSIIHKGGSKIHQKKAIELFHKEQDIRILLIVKQSGVEGLNLQYAANVCVIMDPHFNEAMDEQAASRVDRIGQEREVIIRKLYMEGSIDEAMRIMKEKKESVSEDWTKKKDSSVMLSLENQKLFLEKYDKVSKRLFF